MSTRRAVESLQVHAPGVVGLRDAATAQIAVLQDDEIIQLSIKPSLWYIPIASARFVGVMALMVGLLAFSGAWGSGPIASIVVTGALLASGLRVILAALQWASRLYVLTNRRVLRFSGVLSVHTREARLAHIGRVNLRVNAYQNALRLGSIRMQPIQETRKSVAWDQVARPNEVYEILEKAIRRAQSGD